MRAATERTKCLLTWSFLSFTSMNALWTPVIREHEFPFVRICALGWQLQMWWRKSGFFRAHYGQLDLQLGIFRMQP